jgi:hypothetical protein
MRDPALTLPLNLAKIVETRRRTRMARARQLAQNTELQRSILHTTELYNLETERSRARNALASTMSVAMVRAHVQHADTIGPMNIPQSTEPQRAAMRQMEVMEQRASQLSSSHFSDDPMTLLPGRLRLQQQQTPRNVGRPSHRSQLRNQHNTLDQYAVP